MISREITMSALREWAASSGGSAHKAVKVGGWLDVQAAGGGLSRWAAPPCGGGACNAARAGGVDERGGSGGSPVGC